MVVFNPLLPLDFKTNPCTLEEYLKHEIVYEHQERMIIKTLGAEGLRLQEKQQGKDNKEVNKQIRMEL